MTTPNKLKNKETKLSCRARDIHFKKQFNELKIKIYLNYFELLAFFSVTFFTSYFLLTNFIKPNTLLTSTSTAGITSIIVSYFFYKTRNYQLSITRRDKEYIYMKISKELLKEKTTKKTHSQPSKKVSIAV